MVATTGMLLLGAGADLQYVSDRAHEWLHAYFPGTTDGDLPASVLAWIIHGRSHKTVSPLIVAGDRSHLLLKFVEDSTTRCLVMLRVVEPLVGRVLTQRLSVTAREGEIMCWVAAGKTNPEIAVILQISGHTVDNHLTSIYAKLGVENRYAAICRVLEVSDSTGT